MEINQILIILLILILVIIILTLFFLKKIKKENYVLSSLTGLPDDIIITEILPFLPLEDLLNLNRYNSDGTKLIDKYVRGVLKFQTVCDLPKMQYFRTVPDRKLDIEPSKPWLGALEVSRYSYDLLQGFLELYHSKPQFVKYIKNEEGDNKTPEWIIINSSNLLNPLTPSPNEFRRKAFDFAGDVLVSLSFPEDQYGEDPEDEDGNILKDRLRFSVWFHPNAKGEKYTILKKYLQSKIDEINTLGLNNYVFPLEAETKILGQGRVYYFTLALKDSTYREYVNNIFEMREKPEQTIEEEKEREEKIPISSSSSSSSSSSQGNVPTDSDIVFFIENLKNTPQRKIENLIDTIGDPTLRRILRTDILSYLFSDNYSQYASMFDEEAFNSVKRNPQVFTRDIINLILESLK